MNVLCLELIILKNFLKGPYKYAVDSRSVCLMISFDVGCDRLQLASHCVCDFNVIDDGWFDHSLWQLLP